MAAHRLTLVDRGRPHVHRWAPSCACGWSGIPIRRRRDAEREYAEHRRQQDGRGHRRAMAPPRPLTPLADLPEALR